MALRNCTVLSGRVFSAVLRAKSRQTAANVAVNPCRLLHDHMRFKVTPSKLGSPRILQELSEIPYTSVSFSSRRRITTESAGSKKGAILKQYQEDGLQWTMRQATHDDYDAVMAIASSETFRDGFDYLPARFHDYVEDPNTIFFVGEIDGKVIVLNVMTVIEDGEALLSKTIRVSTKLKGKGIAKKMRQLFIPKFIGSLRQRGKMPTVIRGAVQTQRKGAEKFMQSFTYSSVDDCKWDVMYFRGDVTTLHQHLTSDHVTSLPALGRFQPPDMRRLLPPAFSAAVLSRGLVYVDWDPHQLSDSTMRKFVEAGCYILVDGTEPAARSLSFGGSYVTPRGRVYYIDVHCRDLALCKAHVINHVQNACSQYTGEITFCVMVIDQALKETVMGYCVQNLQLGHLPHDHTYVMFQTDLKSFGSVGKASFGMEAKF